jgi:hypothetical protein
MKPKVLNYGTTQPPTGSDCPICMAGIEETNDVVVAPCRHHFHFECLERWTHEQLDCPVCRRFLPPLLHESCL